MRTIYSTFIILLLSVSLAFARDPLAKQISTDTSHFNNNLSSADTDVQKALETLDDMVASAGEGTTNHAALSNLSYAASGHTGFQPTITTGTTGQYLRGDLSLATFPTNLSSFTNGPGYITGYTETDPVASAKIGTLTNGNFCKGTGTAISCTDASTYVTGTPWTAMGYVTGTPWTSMGYLTGNQTITLGGILSGSGTTSITAAAASGYYMPTTTDQTNWNGKQAALGFTAVPNTRTVNGFALSSDVSIVNISGNAGTATALQTGRTINGVTFDGTGNITVADSTKVPTTRTVNGFALSADVSIVNISGNAATSTSTGSDSTWTSHNSYPTGCNTGYYVQAIGDTLTCAADQTGGGGSISGLTAGKLSVASSSTQIADSIITQAGAGLTIAGSATVNNLMTVSGGMTVSSGMTVTGDATVTGTINANTLNITGTGASIFNGGYLAVGSSVAGMTIPQSVGNTYVQGVMQIGGGLTVSSDVTAVYFHGNGSLLTGISTSGSIGNLDGGTASSTYSGSITIDGGGA